MVSSQLTDLPRPARRRHEVRPPGRPAGSGPRARAIAEVRAAHGTTLPAAAIASPYTRPSIINATLGMRSPDQVARNAELHRRHVPEALWDDLRAQGLIRSEEPGVTGRAGSARCP